MKKFEKNLKQKKYTYCIAVLYEEIKKLLIEKVKEHDKNYTYTSIKDLELKCIKYLDDEISDLAIEFYDFTVNQDIETYEISRLLEIYDILIK